MSRDQTGPDWTDDARLVADLRAALRDAADVRALAFAADGLTIELEVTADALLGQLVPPGAARVETHRRAHGGRDRGHAVDPGMRWTSS